MSVWLRSGSCWAVVSALCLMALAEEKPASETTPQPLAAGAIPYEPKTGEQLLADAQQRGSAKRGADVFGSTKFACISCHKVGQHGGTVGPDLSKIATCRTPQELVEAVLWPKRQVKPEFSAWMAVTNEGQSHQGYKLKETDDELVLRDPSKNVEINLKRKDIDELHEVGSLMPEGLAVAMSSQQRMDVLRFLLELGKTEGLVDSVGMHLHHHVPAKFEFDRLPLHAEDWPHVQHPVNRDRLYDFYTKQALHFRQQAQVPPLLMEYPGLDGGTFGHWGNQNEQTWADDRWKSTELGSVLSGAFKGAGVVVPKGVCVRLGDQGEMAACFNPETLCYEALWEGGFVELSGVRHGFVHGLNLSGKPLPRPAGEKPKVPFVYRGFYRHGPRVVFAYRLGDVEMLDAPWVENGKFVRVVAPAAEHPQAALIKGGTAQWPQVFETKGSVGKGTGPYVIDTIEPPFENPWKALLFFGDHDFLPDGTALLGTMQGDVWRVEGLDEKLEHVRWRRIAAGLHQALGLVVAEGNVYVLGRDQITRLHDLNKDGEADFYECFSNAWVTSPAGHDFICGLQRDPQGHFYTASGNQGILKISPDGGRADVLATGFRNPDGIGLAADGAITVPCSEGDWTPSSMICQIRTGGHYGYRGPIKGQTPDLPLVYLPRGLDNSSGGQVHISSDKWGPLQGLDVHLSFGAGSHFLLLRDEVDGQPQGAVVPLPGEFLSGVHRGRFHPVDGQLYVSGMAGWGAYSKTDGCFQRVRYTGQPVQLPTAMRVHFNGIHLTFSQPLNRDMASQVKNHFVQSWNYRYGPGYGSPEFSRSHFGLRGHDVEPIIAAHVLNDDRSLFLEIPDLQPVNQLHLLLQVDTGRPVELFATAHKLAAPFTDFAGYRPVEKTVLPHPILTDLALATKTVPNPFRKRLPDARTIVMEAGKNLTFATRTVNVKAGEPLMLRFVNPDVVPHNWVLVKPGSLARVGDLANKSVADPEAAVRHYVPQTDDVITYTDIVSPQSDFTIFFRAPQAKGRYPFLCTFPGHWMVMNGEMVVE